jgi:hypothetical protein
MNPVEEDRALDGESDLAYGDGRRGRAAMDPMTRHMVFIACGIGLLFVVLIGGWSLSGSRHSGSIPIIEAEPGPVRLKPVDPGGMQAMGAQAPPAVSASGIETLAPQPETARPEVLQAEVDAALRRDHGQPGVPADPPATSVPAAGPAPSAPLAADPAIHGQSQPGHPPLLQHAYRGGSLAVQLAALDSHDAAQTEWSRLSRGHPSLFSGRVPEVEQADHDGRPIYRLRTGGFASIEQAHAFCEQARSQRVACTLADF